MERIGIHRYLRRGINVNSTYTATTRVGLIRACLRYIEDPTRSYVSRLFLALSPLFVLWVISPLDLVPEAVLGPLGLADDTAILIALFLIVRFAGSFYREKRYTKPLKLMKEKDYIDV